MACAGGRSRQLGATFMPFTAQTRMSGVNLNGREIRKGAADAIESLCQASRRHVFLGMVTQAVESIAKQGGTPLVVAEGNTRAWV